MTIRFPKWLAYSKFALALAMLIALYIGTTPKWWGWLLFLPLFVTIVYEAARTYCYSLTVDEDRIAVGGFKRAEFRVSDIAAVDVWFAKGGRMAVVTFADRAKLSFPGNLVDFEKFVELLRTKANLPTPDPES
ncbi:MAG: hypothetical protein KJ681_03690 [Gammaproteobacteria bacterium]|nr:hypothetical protein [Gammaproteobacteria bacterium]